MLDGPEIPGVKEFNPKLSWLEANRKLLEVEREIGALEQRLFELRDIQSELADKERLARNAFLKDETKRYNLQVPAFSDGEPA